MSDIAVIGAGSWGTALSVHLARTGHEVRLWSRRPELAAQLARERKSDHYLPGLPIPESVRCTADLEGALRNTHLAVLAVPSSCARTVLEAAAGCAPRDTAWISATKGLEVSTDFRMSQVIAQVFGEDAIGRTAVLSGPSFALEVARGLPTAVVVASRSPALTERVQAEFRAPYFRLYGSDDVIGVELGGALKNVIAIAAGAARGMELGSNALAALITRGLAEITRLAIGLGGQRETLGGLAGLGDLVLTCTGELSRNRRVGIELGRGRSLADILATLGMVAEGVHTAGAALELAATAGIEMPITDQMDAVLRRGKPAREAVQELMLRPQRRET